jgi:hypothetical protein
MTISSDIRVVQYIGDGTVSTYDFDFKVFEKSDLVVITTNLSTGVDTTLILTTNYTVALNADQDYNAGGTITLTAGALPTTQKLTISSNIPNLQPTDLSNQGGFYPDVINTSLDRATIQIQQLHDTIGRSLVSSISDDPNVTMALPSAVTRANKYLAFDATGIPLAATGTNTPGVSFPGEVDIVSNNAGSNVPSARDIVFNDYTTELARFTGATRRLGIGTTSPVTKLHVRDSTSAQTGVRIQNAPASGGGLDLYVDTSGYANIWGNDGRIVFGTLSEVMRLTTSSVGIGTANPANRLHVNGANAAAVSMQLTNGTTSGTTATAGVQLRLDASAVAYLTNYTNTALSFQTSAVAGTPVERLRIAADGTITAAAPIDVSTGIVTITGNATVTATTRFLTVNGTASVTVTLPAASSYTGKEIYIKTVAAFTVVSASSNVIPRAGGAAGTPILGAAAGNWALLVSNGTNWVIMAGT